VQCLEANWEFLGNNCRQCCTQDSGSTSEQQVPSVMELYGIQTPADQAAPSGYW